MTTLCELKEIIHDCIKRFELEIQLIPKIILTEGDFERLLTNRIADVLPEGYVIHNQIAYYSNTNKPTYRVDIVVLHESIFEIDSNFHKGFYYMGQSIAIELKYYRKKDSIRTIEKDINKAERMKENKDSFLFVVALFEEFNREKHKIMQSYLSDNGNVELMIISKTK